jgi:hypothetical protein
MVLIQPWRSIEVKDYIDKSFWLATYGDYFLIPALQGDLKVDIAIIGEGFIRLSNEHI